MELTHPAADRQAADARRLVLKKAIGQPYVYPRNDLGYAANLLHMMFAVPSEPYEVDPEVAEALDLLLILHADHEQNCSTSTVRMVGSSHANLYASISAGISALWGPLHGGANEAVIETLEQIGATAATSRSGSTRPRTRTRFRLPGFGHRVYKNFDPRATHHQARRRAGAREPRAPTTSCSRSPSSSRRSPSTTSTSSSASCTRTSTSTPASSTAPSASRRTCSPCCFAIGRLPGWIAQWQEMIRDPETKIGRPRQVYIGPPERAYIPIDER